MNNHNITSGGDYALLLINTLLESQNEVQDEHKLDSTMLKNLFKRIHEYANFSWEEYIKGGRESYLFAEDEMEMIFEIAIRDTTDELIEGLVEKDMVSIAAVNEEGELLYSLTEKGKEYAEQNKLTFKNKRNGKSDS